MDTERTTCESVEYVFSGRRLSGTRAEVLAGIDELIRGLAAVRQLLLQVDAGSAQPSGWTPSRPPVGRSLLCALLVSCALLWARPVAAQSDRQAAPSAAQQTADPNPGAFTLTGGTDVVSRYMFRGIRQQSTGVALWPWSDLGVAAYSGHGGLRSVGINVGTWNSLHTGDTGTDGPSTKLWYESDFYATVGLGFAGGASLATTYTAYTSPNNSYSTVKEIMFKLALDDSARLGRAAVRPYAIVARELDTAAGLGQADTGSRAGTYLELGIAPGYAGARVSLGVPVKVGLSLGNYYELEGVDHRFGFFSAAALVTVPIGSVSQFGAWNVHGGVELQRLGDTTTFFNGGDKSRVIGSFGIGFSY